MIAVRLAIAVAPERHQDGSQSMLRQHPSLCHVDRAFDEFTGQKHPGIRSHWPKSRLSRSRRINCVIAVTSALSRTSFGGSLSLRSRFGTVCIPNCPAFGLVFERFSARASGPKTELKTVEKPHRLLR
jgi:hypothetical protein